MKEMNIVAGYWRDRRVGLAIKTSSGGLSSSPPNLMKQFAATPFSLVSCFLTGTDNALMLPKASYFKTSHKISNAKNNGKSNRKVACK